MCFSRHFSRDSFILHPAPTKVSTSPPSSSSSPTSTTSNHPSIRSSLPSQSPTTLTVDNTIDLESSDTEKSGDSISRGAIIGMSTALGLSLAAAFIVYMHHRPHSSDSSDKQLPKDPNHFGTVSHEPWGKSIASLPLSYMGLNNCSLSSSSSSFRDYRFVNVFDPEGQPIPQFNPNTAAAVVIGSVTIGAASSSYSSGPFAHSGSRSYSSRSHSFFSFGKKYRRGVGTSSGASSKDDMSSLSSHRSSYRMSPKYRPSKQRRQRRPIRTGAHNRVNTSFRTSSQLSTHSPRSNHSPNTVPMSHQKHQELVQRVNSQVSLGDWRAISFMTECKQPRQVTDAGAAKLQREFFFDTILCPEPTLSDNNVTQTSLTCHSLPNHIRCVAGSDAGASSILCEYNTLRILIQPLCDENSSFFFVHCSRVILPRRLVVFTASVSYNARRVCLEPTEWREKAIGKLARSLEKGRFLPFIATV